MRVVSVLLHPLLMPTLLFFILFYHAPLVIQAMPRSKTHLFLLVILITTFIIPVLSIVTLRLTKSISSFQMRDRKERIVPFFFIFIFYALTTYLFISKFDLGNVFFIIFSGITTTIFIITITAFFWKISVHSAGLTGVIGSIFAINYKFPDNQLFIPVIFLILMAGLVMSARLYLNSHTPNEIFVGGIVGFMINYWAILIFA